MPAQYLEIHPQTPEERKIKQVVDLLQDGGIIIYPTDTIYGMGCDIHNARAIERLARIKGVKPEKANFSFICHDLSHLSDYARHVSTPVFKLMKKALPGPFTFILEGSSKVPKILNNNKKQVGIRIPDHAIPRAIVEMLGNPIITTSVPELKEGIEYNTDPELMYETYRNMVDLVIGGGIGGVQPSTIVNCIDDEPVVIREGAGDLEAFL